MSRRREANFTVRRTYKDDRKTTPSPNNCRDEHDDIIFDSNDELEIGLEKTPVQHQAARAKD